MSSQEGDFFSSFFLSDAFSSQLNNKKTFCLLTSRRCFTFGSNPLHFFEVCIWPALKKMLYIFFVLQALNFLHCNNLFYLDTSLSNIINIIILTTEDHLTLGPSSDQKAQSKWNWTHALQAVSCTFLLSFFFWNISINFILNFYFRLEYSCSFSIQNPNYSIFTILPICLSTHCHNSELRKCLTILPSSVLWK